MARPSRYTSQIISGYFQSGEWDTLTMSHIWERNAVKCPKSKAIEDPAKSLTWEHAKTWIDRIALGLVNLGIGRDEVMVVQLPNCVELHLLRVACEKAGIICVPVLSNMREHEMNYILNYVEAVAVVIPDRFRDFDYNNMIQKIKPQLTKLKYVLINDDLSDLSISLGQMSIKEVVGESQQDYLKNRRYHAEEVSIVHITSGTSGFPKFVEYPAAACYKVGEHFASLLKITSEDVVAAIAPAARGPNVTAYFAAPHAIAEIVMVPWINAKYALEIIEQKGVTIACIVPTQLAMMLQENNNHSHDLSSVRIWLSTGSSLPPDLAEAVENQMGGVIINQYGAVDFGAMSIALPEDDTDVRVFTVGKPRFDCLVKIVDDSGKEVARGAVGEIMGKGPCCSSGYYKDPKATSEAWGEDGWFATGDLGRFDEQENLVISGRKKDVIIRGGQNIIPSEIENLLITHPRIQDVAIVAMPDPVMVEKACAYVVLKNRETLSLEEIVSFLKQKDVAPFKLPERLEIVDKLPTVSDGQKVDKKALAQDIAGKVKLER